MRQIGFIPDPVDAKKFEDYGCEAIIYTDIGRDGMLTGVNIEATVGLARQLTAPVIASGGITDLNDVITTHWIMSPEGTQLRVFGPPRTQEVVNAILASLAPDLQYRLDHHADLSWTPNVVVTEVAPGDVFTVGSATVTVGATDHRPVEPTVAFRIDDAGKSVVLGGDGVPCASLDQLCLGADAYVQTVIRDDLGRLIPNARIQDILDYHSSVEQAAETATRAGIRTLVLTHYVPSMQPGQEDDWRSRAAAHFAGDIVLGDDLTAVEL
jgi:ribonuclease Z